MKFLQFLWIQIKKIVYGLQPGSFSLVVLVLGFIFLDIVAQGQDAVLGLAGVSLFPGQLLFLLATLLWAVQVWYWARNVYILRHHRLKASPYYPAWATKMLPRVLGIAAFLVTTYALFDMARYAKTLYWLGGVYLLLTFLFYLFLHQRRIIFKTSSLEVILEKVAKNSAPEGIEPGFSHLPPKSRKTLVILTVVASIPLVLFLISPQVFTFEGAAAVAILCFSIWVPLGSWILLLSFRWKVPVFGILLMVAIIFGLWNDNHHVRVKEESPLREDLAARLDNFLQKYPDEKVAGNPPPLYIVSTEGGGIRAAYWTAIILGKIQDRLPQFSEHLLAISSVSGGSLGSAVYAALVKENLENPDRFQGEKNFFFTRGREMLSRDFLSPTVAAMFTGDFLQALLPFPVEYFSRGYAMERSWEISWAKTFQGKSHRFGEPLGRLWEGDTACRVPVLFLNGTLVETGQRIIGSPIKINPSNLPDFVDALDIYRYTSQGKDMPLSTAIHNSARFTYVSPAGTLEGGIHVVDGGYFDNSGASTAMELIYAVMFRLKTMNKKVRLKVIMIDNEPVAEKAKQKVDQQGPDPLESLETQEVKPLRFLSGFLAPILSLLNVRNAHASMSQDALKRLTRVRGGTFILLVPENAEVKLPLGWTLSAAARQEMDAKAEDSLRKNWSKIADSLD